MECSNDNKYIYQSIEYCNPGMKRKVLIMFDDMTANMISSKKLYPLATGFFTRGWKMNIYFAFTTQLYLSVPKDVRTNTRSGPRINFRMLQNFTKKYEHRNDVICRKIID